MKMKHALYLVAVGLVLTAIIFAYGIRIEKGIINSYSDFDGEMRRGTVMTNDGEFFNFEPKRRECSGHKIKMLIATGFDSDPANDEIICVF